MNIRSPRQKGLRGLTLAVLVGLTVLLQTGCGGPTYPKAILDEAVVQLCREEYGIEVKAELAGDTTIAVYLPIENLLDPSLSISEEARDKINDVTLSVSRVTLSSDAPIKFHIVIAQDPSFPEIEGVIIRYLKDIKQLYYGQISRGEFAKRALGEMKITPQAQKEKVLKNIFEQLNIGESEELMEEFLDKDVSAIGDIGYWNDKFFIKEITLEEFLAVQVAERTKRELMIDPELKDKFKVNALKGLFVTRPTKKGFEFDLDISGPGEELAFASEEETGILFKLLLDEAAHVLRGYKFEDYEFISITDKASRERIVLTKTELEEFRKKRITIGDLRWKR